MKFTRISLQVFLLPMILFGCKGKQNKTNENRTAGEFPNEMVEFIPYKNNPVFSGTGSGTWDKKIRERGYILFEDSVYKMWYSGYKGNDDDPKFLGYATSDDGISWRRYSDAPVFDQKWTEDMFVVKNENKYYMFAEGKNDIAHFLTSVDGINWQEQGDIIIQTTNGRPIPGPYGTPAIWIENGKWYLFYECNDEAIWLATSTDMRIWTNVRDEPVIKPGPNEYDAGAVAANQVVKFKGKYYMYYHASANSNWADTSVVSLWSSNVAMSEDLLNWVKYPGNPIVKGDHSSPIIVFDGNKYRLYTMHPDVCLYFNK